MDCEETQSRVEENVSKEEAQIQYQQCPNCNRRFFKGRLALHQKLCTDTNPMLVSHSPRIRSTPPVDLPSKAQYSPRQRKCPHCHTKLPNFLFNSHVKKCLQPEQQDRKNIDQTSFQAQKQIRFLAIRKSPRLIIPKNKQHAKVKAKEELSCFRLAQEIQKVQCHSCGRHFAKQAAQRHIPICQKLRTQEKFDSIFKNRNSPRAVIQNGKQSTMKKKVFSGGKGLKACQLSHR